MEVKSVPSLKATVLLQVSQLILIVLSFAHGPISWSCSVACVYLCHENSVTSVFCVGDVTSEEPQLLQLPLPTNVGNPDACLSAK